jgi:hypothetical protein
VRLPFRVLGERSVDAGQASDQQGRSTIVHPAESTRH